MINSFKSAFRLDRYCPVYNCWWSSKSSFDCSTYAGTGRVGDWEIPVDPCSGCPNHPDPKKRVLKVVKPKDGQNEYHARRREAARERWKAVHQKFSLAGETEEEMWKRLLDYHTFLNLQKLTGITWTTIWYRVNRALKVDHSRKRERRG